MHCSRSCWTGFQKVYFVGRSSVTPTRAERLPGYLLWASCRRDGPGCFSEALTVTLAGCSVTLGAKQVVELLGASVSSPGNCTGLLALCKDEMSLCVVKCCIRVRCFINVRAQWLSSCSIFIVRRGRAPLTRISCGCGCSHLQPGLNFGQEPCLMLVEGGVTPSQPAWG